MVILGDFNLKLNSWYANDNKNIDGSKMAFLHLAFINSPFEQFFLFPLLNIYIITESTNKSGVHSSLHTNCIMK